jgi:flavin reductase (DIM6/NTAB) family NADH-FMN oxidoreductase RutF
MAKIKIGNNAFTYPMPVTIVGAHVKGKPNHMAISWVSMLSSKPPLIGIVSSAHYTTEGIKENKEFSVCVPSIEMIKATDYVGIVSGTDKDKSKIFDCHYGELKNSPMIKDCPVSVECKLVQTVKLPEAELLIGEIINTYGDEKYMTDGKLDIKKMKPFTLTMPDNNYCAVGQLVGKAWEDGVNYKK